MKFVSPSLLVAVVICGLATSACKKSESVPTAAKNAPKAVGVGVEGGTDPAGGNPAAGAPGEPPPQTISSANAKAPDVPKGEPALITIKPNDPPDVQAKFLTSALNVWEDWNGGKAPQTLNQLAEKRIIDVVPTPPQGMKFVINARTHQVELKSE